VRKRNVALGGLLIGWIGSIGTGLCGLLLYEAAGEPGADAPAAWPATSSLPSGPNHSTLLMFAHPHCPCTVASVHELEWVLSRAGERVHAVIICVCPPGAPSGWEQTDLYRQVCSIPNLHIVIDRDGDEARRFRARRSGHTLVYDPYGRLVFSGTLTAGRGHEGDNPGRQAALQALTGNVHSPQSGFVYGCPLLGTERCSLAGDSECQR
jgi:hypothetical protein